MPNSKYTLRLAVILQVGSTSPVEDFQALVADKDVSFAEGCYFGEQHVIILYGNVINYSFY